MIRVPKRPSDWKGLRITDKTKIVRHINNRKKKNEKMSQPKVISQINHEKSLLRKKDLYLNCKRTYELPSTKENYAQIMKDEYSIFNAEYYIKFFEFFKKLIDNKKIHYIEIEMFKDINNIFIQMEKEYSHENITNVALNLSNYISSKKKMTKKMTSLLDRCKNYL